MLTTREYNYHKKPPIFSKSFIEESTRGKGLICHDPAEREALYKSYGSGSSIANAIDYRGLLAELVPSSVLGPGIRGPCPWEF